MVWEAACHVSTGADELLEGKAFMRPSGTVTTPCPLSGGQECDLELGESTLNLLVWNITYRVSKGYKQKETPFHELQQQQKLALHTTPTTNQETGSENKEKRRGQQEVAPTCQGDTGVARRTPPLYSEKLL